MFFLFSQCLHKDCTAAVHVGCAKWIDKGNTLNVFPGNDDSDPHMEFYCKKHSKTKCKIIKKAKKEKKASKGSPQRTKSASAHNIDDDDDCVIFDSDSDSSVDSSNPKNPEKSKKSKKPKKLKKSNGVNKKLPAKNPSLKKNEKPEKGQSKYFQDKERLDKSLAKMVQDLKAAIANSVNKNVEIDVVKKRIGAYWRNHGGLTKTEFNKLWSKCEVAIEDDERKALNLKSQKKKAGKIKRQRPFQNEQIFDPKKIGNKGKRKKRQENKWIHLFAPYYQEGLIDFDDEKLCERTYISETEMEDSDRQSKER